MLLYSSLVPHIPLPSPPPLLPPPLSPSSVKVVNRLIAYVFAGNDVAFSEELLVTGNQCMMELSRCLQGHLANHSQQVAGFILRQLEEEELCSQRHASSIVQLLLQVLGEELHCRRRWRRGKWRRGKLFKMEIVKIFFQKLECHYDLGSSKLIACLMDFTALYLEI